MCIRDRLLLLLLLLEHVFYQWVSFDSNFFFFFFNLHNVVCVVCRAYVNTRCSASGCYKLVIAGVLTVKGEVPLGIF